MKYLLVKEKIADWITQLQQTARVVAPVVRAGELRFDYIRAANEVILGSHNTRRSPKWVFFPQSEVLLRYGKLLDDYSRTTAVEIDKSPRVLLGAAPCDARSLILLDRIFGQGVYQDPYYCARRANTLVISYACERPTSTCFCHAIGSSPFDTTGADVLLSSIGGDLVVDLVSEAGRRAGAGWNLAAADEGTTALVEAASAVAVDHLQPVEKVAGIEHDLAGLFDSGIWREIAEKCIACGTCTYNCPECHCFNIVDNELSSGGERLRSWDACMYSQFTVQASGYNPRPDQASRWRQRVMHKFSYLPANVGIYGCVGCGRCIVSCPVRLDIRQVLQRVRQEARIQLAAASAKEG